MNIQLVSWTDIKPKELATLANNKKISDTLRDIFPYPYTTADAEKWIGLQKNISPSLQFAIKATDKLAGGIGCIPQTDVYRKSMEIGYWIGESFWNNGIATDAVKKMTNYVFTSFDIERIFAGAFEINKASMKVLEKAGYHLEAIHKKAVFKNEVVMDEFLYVKLK